METMSQHPRDGAAPEIGALAPDFILPDGAGTPHTLSKELQDGKPIVLVFMRGEW